MLQSWVLEPPAKSASQQFLLLASLLSTPVNGWRFQVGKLEGHPMMKAEDHMHVGMFRHRITWGTDLEAEAMGIMNGRPHPEAAFVDF